MSKKYFSRMKEFKKSKLGSLFILKIMKCRPEGVDVYIWLELIFGLHEREIVQYETVRSFVIPGLYKPVPHVRVGGYKIPRTVPQSQRVWVRLDEKYPNVIDFEAPIAIGNEPRIFQLNREEWDHIKMWLEPVGSAKSLNQQRAALDLEQNKIIQTLPRR